MNTADAVLATLRAQVTDIVLGTVFLSVGAAACAIAAIRWRRGVRILVWWGIFSGMFGLQTLVQTPAILAVLPHRLDPAIPYISTAIMYLLLVSALLAWRELSLGRLRFLLQVEIFVGLAIAVAGIGTFVLTGSAYRWMFYNNLLAVFAMLILVAVVLVSKFARKFLVIANHRVLAIGTLIFAVEALYTNLSTVLQYRTLPLVSSLGFIALLLSLGYVALEMVSPTNAACSPSRRNWRRHGRFSPPFFRPAFPKSPTSGSPLRYHPMTAVAGDFYQFVRADPSHLGILVADVSGHGIPAALISSMIKVAMQSVAVCAHDPAQVLGGLNRILTSEAHGQLASAAYLWIDTGNRNALYSAAGHPPLLCWRNNSGEMQRIESNGLLFGIESDSNYPVCRVPVEPATASCSIPTA